MYELLVILLVSTSYANAQSTTTTSDGCWTRVAECSLSCGRPNRVISAEEQQCLDACRSDPTCEGVVYNRYAPANQRCSLYDSVPLDGLSGQGGGRGRPQGPGGFGFGKGRGGGPPPGPPRRGGKGNGRFRGRFRRDDGDTDSDSVAAQADAGDIQYHRGGRSGYYSRGSGDRSGGGRGGSCVKGQRGSTIYKWNGRCPRGGVSTIGPPTVIPTIPGPLNPQCPAGQTGKYLRIQDFENVGTPYSSIQGSQEDCIRACSSSSTCKSTNYNAATRQCELFTSGIDFNSASGGAPATGTTYYEKVCITGGGGGGGCDLYIDASPQYTLIGHATMVVDRNSYAECVQACYESQQQFGVECKSALYYPEYNQCLINNADKSEFPDLFVPEGTDLVTYFEINCPNVGMANFSDMRVAPPTLIVVGATKWGDWSPCDKQKGKKYRFRNCKTNAPHTCEKEEEAC